MTTQRNKYSKLPRLPDRTPQSQGSESRLGVGSTLIKLGTLAIALVITNLGLTHSAFAQAQIPRNPNSQTPQPLPSDQNRNIDLPDQEPPQPLPPHGIYEHPDFFEEGEEKLERSIDRLRERRDEDESEEDVLTIEEQAYWENRDHPDSLLTLRDPETGWIRVVSTQGEFAVSLPKKPTDVTAVPANQATDLDLEAYRVNQAPQRFVIAYSEETTLADPEAKLRQVRDQILAETDAQLRRDRRISLDGYPGRSFQLRTPNQLMTYKLYWVDDRLYVLRASQQQPEETYYQAAQFFNSFEPITQWDN
ncbi:hypothetical protein [Coleofasciculus sp.]|uniref:hypothetical protein n=1 Tax=Coleofasciculus sp. TaxID=3100458 RepID=UPI003A26BD18